MSTSFRLLVPRQFHTDMVLQAQAELPNECCGMLAGRVENGPAGPVGRVLCRYPLVNAAANPWEYVSEPRSMLNAEKARRAEGLEFLATYHSHPRSRPVPSIIDLERNYSPDVVTMIVSLQTDVPEIRGWWLDGNEYREAAVEWIEK
ncbi:MAG TPA: M67 family metallopeptidase [Gemmataceae bacterium]|nr:M67 family metallopeptidase [Gemmataceae bacterium]